MIVNKTCYACNQTKPLDDFPKNRSRKDGHDGRCKICSRMATKKYADSNREQVRRLARERAHRDRIEHPEKQRQRQAKYRNSHKDKLRQAANEYNERHPRYQANYQNKHRKRLNEQSREHTHKHPEQRKKTQKKYRLTHQEQIREHMRVYQRNNRLKKRINSQRRRAMTRDLPATFTDVHWQRCLAYFGNCCAVCGRPQGLWHKLAQDHWTPVTSGGGYTPNNIVPLCHGIGGCNNSKNNRDPHNWLIAKFGKHNADQIEQRIADYFEWVKQQSD